MNKNQEISELKQTVFELAKIVQYCVYAHDSTNQQALKAAGNILGVPKGIHPFQYASDRIDEIVDSFEKEESLFGSEEITEESENDGDEVDDNEVEDPTLDLGSIDPNG